MRMETQITKTEVEGIISLHEKMRNSYFWSPPCVASSRRSYEKKNSLHVVGDYNGHEIDLECSTECSCKNIYYKGTFIIDGVKKNIRGVKALLK